MLVFISHNKGDREVARDVAIYLAAENLSVWFDEWEVAAGDSIVAGVERGLRECTHFLVIWSHNASSSRWVGREMQSVLAEAIRSGKPRIIPLVLDDTPLPALLADIRYMRYRGGTEDDRARIVNEVLGRSPSRTFIGAIVKKYHEVIGLRTKGDFAACPECGSVRLRYSQFTDHESMDSHDFVNCSECKWSEMFN